MQLLVDAEIRMNSQLASALYFVVAAAKKIRIRNQALNASQAFQKLQHGWRIEKVKQGFGVCAAIYRIDAAFQILYMLGCR